MRADESLRRALIDAWEKADTMQEALDNIDAVVTGYAHTALPIEERTWGGWDKNVYSNPENCGLDLLAAAGKEPDYDFDLVILLQDKASGRYFMCHDSGCSCPSPFEDVRSVSDLTEIRTRADAQGFLTANMPPEGFSAVEFGGMLNAIKEIPRWPS